VGPGIWKLARNEKIKFEKFNLEGFLISPPTTEVMEQTTEKFQCYFNIYIFILVHIYIYLNVFIAELLRGTQEHSSCEPGNEAD